MDREMRLSDLRETTENEASRMSRQTAGAKAPMWESPRSRERLYIRAAVELEFSGPEEAVEGYTRNISYGGIGLYVRRPLAVGREVWVGIHYLNGCRLEGDEAVCSRVRWCRPEGAWFAAGIEFERMDEDLNPALIAFLEQTEWLRNTGREQARH